MLSVSEDDLQLLKAIKPFMSSKSQELLDIMVTVFNVFKPQQPDQKINLDALTELLTMIHESFEAEKMAKVNKASQHNDEIPQVSKDVQNLLNILAEQDGKSI
ncbi:hypothetical protein [Thermoanaerobacterium sp. DL9XJH110]|uniref:hypothetical protein n=1 Tax=Thermoanaerobacterium sp. DL9XJH110 TaxID=3386643 RepID=UPI003BB738E3